MGGYSKSLLAFKDCQEVFDRAIATDGKGIRLRFKNDRARDRFMFRCFWYRGLDRDNNAILYPEPGHTMHGRSLYDTLSIVKEEEGSTLKIEKIEITFEIEEF